MSYIRADERLLGYRTLSVHFPAHRRIAVAWVNWCVALEEVCGCNEGPTRRSRGGRSCFVQRRHAADERTAIDRAASQRERSIHREDPCEDARARPHRAVRFTCDAVDDALHFIEYRRIAGAQ